MLMPIGSAQRLYLYKSLVPASAIYRQALFSVCWVGRKRLVVADVQFRLQVLKPASMIQRDDTGSNMASINELVGPEQKTLNGPDRNKQQAKLDTNTL